MSIKTYWYKQGNRVLFVNFQGSWTWKDFYTAFDTAYDMTYDTEQPVIVIVNTLSSSTRCFTGEAVAQFCAVANQLHPNTGHIIVVANNTMIRQLFDTLRRINGRFRRLSTLVDNIEQAKHLSQSLTTRPPYVRELAS